MSIKPKIFLYLPYTLILLLFAPILLTEEIVIPYVTVSEEIFSEPHDIVLSPDGRQLFVADNGNDRIVLLDAQTCG